MNPLHLIVRTGKGVASRWRNLWYRALGVRIEGYAWLQAICIGRNWGDITLGCGVALDDGVVLLCSGSPKRDKLIIKAGTYVNRHTMFDAHKHIEIGPRCMIGPYCYFTDANHGMAKSAVVSQQPMRVRPLVVEEEVWIGAGVCVMSGVRIGQGAIVGAGAVVTHDVPPWAVVAGVPARVLKQRS